MSRPKPKATPPTIGAHGTHVDDAYELLSCWLTLGARARHKVAHDAAQRLSREPDDDNSTAAAMELLQQTHDELEQRLTEVERLVEKQLRPMKCADRGAA